jgi:tetratricopeptide (TPR) repeat protein
VYAFLAAGGCSLQVRLCTGNADVKWDQQINDCTALIQSGTRTGHNQAIFFSNRGNAYKAKGDLDRAMEDYNEVIQLYPTYTFVLNNRGNVYQAKGDLDRAIADYNGAIRLDLKFAGAYNNRGVTYRRKNDYTQAIADFDQAIALDPKNADVFNSRCWAKALFGELPANQRQRIRLAGTARKG